MGPITRVEWQTLASLAALAGIYWWFQMRMLDGLAVVDQAPSKLLWVYFVVIAFATIAEIVIASVGGNGRAILKDERDHAIEARANQNERFFILAAINVLIWQALWEGAVAGHIFPKIDLTRLPVLFFWLFTILFAGEAIKRLSTLWLYRTQSAAA